MAARVGLEPTTFALTVRRSTFELPSNKQITRSGRVLLETNNKPAA